MGSGDGEVGGREWSSLPKSLWARVSQVTILRGKDGYGFTICSDSPVRVQAVDPGESGPSETTSLNRGLGFNQPDVRDFRFLSFGEAFVSFSGRGLQ